MPALRTEGHPAEVDTDQVVRFQCELDDAAGEGVIEGGDELRELFDLTAESVADTSELEG